MERIRITFLDSARGFAAAWVLLFHINSGTSLDPGIYRDFVSHGYLGVPIFFVISGYSIHSSLLRAPPLKAFLWARFWRIYPPYFASMMVVAVVVIVRWATHGSNDLVPVPDTLLQWFQVLTLSTKPLGSTSPINVVYWTLTYEVAFYLWLSLALLVPRLRWAVIFAPVGLSLAWHDAPIFFVDKWGTFALGVAIAEFQHRRGALPCALAALCMLDLLLYAPLSEVIAAGSTFMLVLMALTSRFSGLNRIPLLPRMGDWSYSLYLTHVPICTFFGFPYDFNAVRRIGMSAHIAVDALFFALACGFAVVFWMLVERPAIAMARQRPFFRPSKPVDAPSLS